MGKRGEPDVGQIESWPASQKDWLAAHWAVRLGRLDRFPWVRRTRIGILRAFAHNRSGIRFATPYGFEMLLPCAHTSLVNSALRGNLFHSKLPELLAEVIRPGDVFVDGGSHHGFYSLMAGSLLEGRGRVFAFEPDPASFDFLRKNVEWNRFTSLIQVEQMALASTNEPLDFWASGNESMLSSLIWRNQPDPEKIHVSAVRMDDYMAGIGQKQVDVIKLDLEGAEPMALEGMTTSLRASKLLIVEVCRPYLAQVGVDPVPFVEETVRRGNFEVVMFIDEKSHSVHSWNADRFRCVLAEYAYANVLCAKASVIPASFGKVDLTNDKINEHIEFP